MANRKTKNINEEITTQIVADNSFFLTNKTVVASVVLAVLCLLIYAQTFGFDFINIDDRAYVYENRAVINGLYSKTLYWAFTAFYAGNWHPLTWISHILDFTLFGLNPNAYHAVNVFFHIINSILTLYVFHKLTGDFVKSSIVAALFAIHPAHVESVAWIAERKDVLSTMFWLLTMLAYFKFVKAESIGKNRKVFYLLMLLCFTCGLMSKSMLVTLPFVLLLCDFWSLERLKTLRDLKPLIIEKIPLFLIMIGSVIITILSQKSASAIATFEAVSLESRLMNVVLSYAKYVVMSVYPANLGFYYPFESKFETWQLVGSIILIASITIFAWLNRTERKYILTGWLWFLGTLVPVIGFVQIGMQSLADRYTYVPYFGLFVMFVWGVGELFERFKLDQKVFAAVFTIIILVLTGVSFNLTSYWKNSETLYTRTLELTKNNYFIMSNLCLHYVVKTTPQIAESKCVELLGQTPPNIEAFNILGMLRLQVGKYDEAVKNFQSASQINAEWSVPFSNLSTAYTKLGNLVEAENAWQKSYGLKDAEFNKPTLAATANTIGTEFLKRGQTEKASFYFTKATELQPNSTESQENLRKAKEQKQ
jgi:protein O-mannosyl-transferase